MTRHTVQAIVEVTYEASPQFHHNYTSRCLANDIRERVFEAIDEELYVDVVIKTVTAGEESEPATDHTGLQED